MLVGLLPTVLEQRFVAWTHIARQGAYACYALLLHEELWSEQLSK